MPKGKSPFTRRSFLKTSLAAAAGAASLPITGSAFTYRPPARYIRYNVMSQGGQKAIKSYNIAIEQMLKLPPTHAQNWFRNAFIHLMDCPHGNWWFYVWHRGYMGYFEETIRNLSGDSTFAMPYWDWTTLPEIPAVMFDGVLTPTADMFAPYTKTLDVFTAFIGPALMSYWTTLTPAQRNQLNIRGYKNFDLMWNDVTGDGDPGNMAFATTATARYLTRENPKLDADTYKNCTPETIKAGLDPEDFYNASVSLSFTSKKTESHNSPPTRGAFSMLEGLPHNIIHNYIGGVTNIDPGPYGNMTNNLSPVDPLFFLHHSNMDRLWDVWTRKQQRLGLPYLPPKADLETLSIEPFLFYVNGSGQVVPNSRAGEYLSVQRFDYDYEPGFPETMDETSSANQKRPRLQIRGTVRGNKATLAVPSDAVKEHLTTAPAAASLVAEVTVPLPSKGSPTRQFHVLVGAPEDVTEADPNSPYYAGTVAFFGNMSHAHGPAADATFAVPLPKAPQAFKGLAAATSAVNIRIVPAYGPKQSRAVLKAATVRAQ